MQNYVKKEEPPVHFAFWPMFLGADFLGLDMTKWEILGAGTYYLSLISFLLIPLFILMVLYFVGKKIYEKIKRRMR